MKHLKLYESFLDTLNAKLHSVVDADKTVVDDIMQTLIDEYSFDNLYTMGNSSFSDETDPIVRGFTYVSDSEIQSSDVVFINELRLINKKLKTMSLMIALECITTNPKLPNTWDRKLTLIEFEELCKSEYKFNRLVISVMTDKVEDDDDY